MNAIRLTLIALCPVILGTQSLGGEPENPPRKLNPEAAVLLGILRQQREAADREQLRKWIEAKDVMSEDQHRRSALRLAINLQDLNAMEQVIELGALNPGAIPDGPDGGRPPLHDAIRSKEIDAVRLLLDRGANLHKRDDFGWTAFGLAASLRQEEMLLALFEAARDRGELFLGIHRDGIAFIDQALCESARYSLQDWCSRLIEAGADVNAVEQQMYTPLISASAAGSEEIVQMLLDRGARLEAAPKGSTAVDSAAGYGRTSVVTLLVRAGTKLRPGLLESAVMSKRAEMFRHLLTLGVQPDPSVDLLEKAIIVQDVSTVQAVLQAIDARGQALFSVTQGHVERARAAAQDKRLESAPEILRLVETAQSRDGRASPP